LPETLQQHGRYQAMAASIIRILVLFSALMAPGAPARAETISLEVHSSSVERDRVTNEMVVTIELSVEAKTAFENFTERNVGRSIEIRLGTMLLLKARLVEKISGGIIRASTKFSEDEARKVAAQLKRGTLITLKDAGT